jgi:hypothetical protein
MRFPSDLIHGFYGNFSPKQMQEDTAFFGESRQAHLACPWSRGKQRTGKQRAEKAKNRWLEHQMFLFLNFELLFLWTRDSEL